MQESYKPGIIFKSGEVRSIARLPSRAYIRGQTINFKLEVENRTSCEIAEVTACIVLAGQIRSGRGRLCHEQQDVRVKSRQQTYGSIAANDIATISCELPQDFSELSIDNNLMPCGTTRDYCKLIDFKYQIEVKLVRKGFKRNVNMKTPITVGTCKAAML